ncbi:ATP-dependent DNA helicase yku80 [Tilletia horrida]|nr:ATP-dependent DNA helicase yku80 [Tilletia horrida]
MSGSRTITAFVVDVSPAMAGKTTIKENVYVPVQKHYEEREREISHVELASELICLKLKESIFADLKTNKCLVLTFGSPRTNNIINSEQGGYEGVDMIWPIKQPNLETIEIVRKLRAAKREDAPKKADPLDALVVAVSTILNPEASGLKTSQKDTWTRNIYLITDASQPMDITDVDSIKNSLIEQKIGLKVVGVNFDDELVGFQQPNKHPTKLHNEHFWHEFLDGVPESGVASIDYVYQDNLRPEVKITKSAMKKTRLTLGDPDHTFSDDPADADKLLSIDVRVGKLVAVARPITQRKVSLLSQKKEAIQQIEKGFAKARAEVDDAPSATPSLPDYRKLAEAMRRARAAGAEVEEVSADGAHGDGEFPPAAPTYAVKYRKMFFKQNELTGIGSEKKETAGAVPISGARRVELPDGKHRWQYVDDDEPDFARGWRLGKSLVPITDDLHTDPVTKAGIEILGFNKKGLPPFLKFGETYYVMADDKDLEAQAQLSALATALQQLKRFALVRWVKSDNSGPLLCALMPPADGQADCLHMVALPFSNDVRGWTYQPLNRVIDKLGEIIYDHPTLPTERMTALTDRLIDATDLMSVKDDESDETYEFGPPDDILNPYIHRVKQEVVNRATFPGRPLLAPHPELTRNFHPPSSVLESFREVRQELEDEGFLPQHRARIVMKSKKRIRSEDGKGDQEPEGADDAQDRPVTEKDFVDEPSNPASEPKKKARRDADDGDSDGTGHDGMSEDGDRSGAKGSLAPLAQQIGLTSPVEDFRRELEAVIQFGDGMDGAGSAEGSAGGGDGVAEESAFGLDRVMRSMEQTIWRLTEGQRIVGGDKDALEKVDHDKARECLRAYRAAALEYDETARFNDFLKSFKKQVAESKHKTIRSFWTNYLQNQANCSLITGKEDPSGSVSVTEAEAEEFIST